MVDARYERESNHTLLETIVDALAEAEGVGVTELPPLYDTIETEALSQLLENNRGNGDAQTLVSFAVDDWNVFVHADGRVRICDDTRQGDPEQVFDDSIA